MVVGNGYTLIYTYQNKTDSSIPDVKGNYTFKYYMKAGSDSMERRTADLCNAMYRLQQAQNPFLQDQSVSIFEGPSNKMITVVSNIDISRITIMDISGIEIRTQIVNDVAPLRYCVNSGSVAVGYLSNENSNLARVQSPESLCCHKNN
ncbi:MAG: hypothetical protein U0T81_12385 [Saprospiraceae bacterium]